LEVKNNTSGDWMIQSDSGWSSENFIIYSQNLNFQQISICLCVRYSQEQAPLFEAISQIINFANFSERSEVRHFLCGNSLNLVNIGTTSTWEMMN
jgi:uncharacterized metal-binding protein